MGDVRKNGWLSLATMVVAGAILQHPAMAQDAGFPAMEEQRFEAPGLIFNGEIQAPRRTHDLGILVKPAELNGAEHAMTVFGLVAKDEAVDLSFSQTLKRDDLRSISPEIWNDMPLQQRLLNLYTPNLGLDELNTAPYEQAIARLPGWDRMENPGVEPAWGAVPFPNSPLIDLPGGGIGHTISGTNYTFANLIPGPPEQLIPFPETPDRAGYRFLVHGFTDVMSLYSKPLPEDEIGHGCGAVLISRSYAITAAHCIASTAGRLAQRANLSAMPTGEDGWSEITMRPKYKIWLYLNLGKDLEIAVANQPNIPLEDRVLHKVQTVFLPYSNQELGDLNQLKQLWPGKYNGDYSRDIALIRFESEIGDTDQRLARLPDTEIPGHNSRITLAGFGVTNVASATVEGGKWARHLLVIGNWETLRKDGFLTWKMDNRGGGGPCTRDSGTGVFRNWHFGLPGEQRDLLAIVSAVNFSGLVQPGVSRCGSTGGIAVRVSQFKAAICALTESAANGCAPL